MTKSYPAGLIPLVLFLGLVIGSFQAMPPGAQAQAGEVVISDGLFDPATWTVQAETQGGGAYQTQQNPSGGNPGPYHYIEYTLPPVDILETSSVKLYHFYQGATYNPATQGAIDHIDYSEDSRLFNLPYEGAFTNTHLIIRQGGQNYHSKSPLQFINHTSWQRGFLSNLTAADFRTFDGSPGQPDFSASGAPMTFGFIRGHSRLLGIPLFPSGQNLTYRHGIDNWTVTLWPEGTGGNRPPVAVNDLYVLPTYSDHIISTFLNVLENDSDPDGDPIKITEAEANFGQTGKLDNGIIYGRADSATPDEIHYRISDGQLTADATAKIYIDCSCILDCLANLVPSGTGVSGQDDGIDLPLIYRVRDQVLASTPDGQRYIDYYYTRNPEILVNILANEPLRVEAVNTVALWQNNLRSLVNGDGSAKITQAQVEAIDQFLTDLSALSSPELQQVITGERARLGPLESYVGMTVKAARSKAIGNPVTYLPLIIK